MMISAPTTQESYSEEKDAAAADSTQQSSTPTPVVFNSPLTPINAVEFSTPHELSCRRSLLLDNDELMDALGTFDYVFYNSDGNEPPEVTETDSFRNENVILQEVPTDVIPPVD